MESWKAWGMPLALPSATAPPRPLSGPPRRFFGEGRGVGCIGSAGGAGSVAAHCTRAIVGAFRVDPDAWMARPPPSAVKPIRWSVRVWEPQTMPAGDRSHCGHCAAESSRGRQAGALQNPWRAAGGGIGRPLSAGMGRRIVREHARRGLPRTLAGTAATLGRRHSLDYRQRRTLPPTGARQGRTDRRTRVGPLALPPCGGSGSAKDAARMARAAGEVRRRPSRRGDPSRARRRPSRRRPSRRPPRQRRRRRRRRTWRQRRRPWRAR